MPLFHHPKDRLMAFVAKTDDDHWLWTGAQTSQGYGQFFLQGKIWPAHRAAYVLLTGFVIPQGHQVVRNCGLKLCVNPEHLTCQAPLAHMEDWERKAALSSPGRMRRPYAKDARRHTWPIGSDTCEACNKPASDVRPLYPAVMKGTIYPCHDECLEQWRIDHPNEKRPAGLT